MEEQLLKVIAEQLTRIADLMENQQKRDVVEKEILKIIKTNLEIEKFLKDQTIKKSIFVPNRLINIIL